MGPLGLFFARLSRHLEAHGVPVYKLTLPLHEFGFQPRQRLPYSGPPEAFPAILSAWIERLGIRHVFMYGDYITLHRLALAELRRHPQVSVGVFELGYIRPFFITLEPAGVNARSGLPRNPAYYQGLPAPAPLPPAPSARQPQRRLLRMRLAKAATFVVHAFQRYPLLPYPHKLQPQIVDLWAQYLGILRGLIYPVSEAPVRRRLRCGTPYVLVALQVATDSQIREASPYTGMEPLIEELTASFAAHAPAEMRLVFKHHPRDRGYNHYGRLIADLRRRFRISRRRLLYFHDAPLSSLLTRPHCRGLITVSSTVGLEALASGVPVKLMGDAFFAIDGLVDQGPLARFWQEPQRPDRQLWERFQRELLLRTQYPGNFDGTVNFDALVLVDRRFNSECS
jgi:capsular polysaccharide export protein